MDDQRPQYQKELHRLLTRNTYQAIKIIGIRSAITRSKSLDTSEGFTTPQAA